MFRAFEQQVVIKLTIELLIAWFDYTIEVLPGDKAVGQNAHVLSLAVKQFVKERTSAACHALQRNYAQSYVEVYVLQASELQWTTIQAIHNESNLR